MLKEIIYNNDSYELKCEKIAEFLNKENEYIGFIRSENQSKDFIDFAAKALKFFKYENNSENSDYKWRYFILNTLNKCKIENEFTNELTEILHEIFEKDNPVNVMLALNFFAISNRCNVLDEKGLEYHSNSLLQLVNTLFNKLENMSDDFIQETFTCLIELFVYLNDLNQRYPQLKSKMDVMIFRSVNFYISYLDEKNVMDLINYKKPIALVIISSISKLIKLISNTNVFIVRNENYSNTILELSKFAIFYCPINASEVRKELLYFIFKMIIKSRDIFVPKIADLFDIRFFYCSEGHVTNVKGLVGLTDVLVSSDNFRARTYFDLMYRTGEVLYTSISIIKQYSKDKKQSNHENLELIRQNSCFFMNEDKKFLKYEISIYFHLEALNEIINCINKQMYTIYTSRLQVIEQIELSYKAFLLVISIIETLEILQENVLEEKVSQLTKTILIAISKFFHELSDRLFEYLQTTSEALISMNYKKEDFFMLFDVSLNLFHKMEFEEVEFQIINDFFSIFCLPLGFLFGDLNNHFCNKIIQYAHKKMFFFEIITKMSSTMIGQYSGISNYVTIIKKLLTWDFLLDHNYDQDESKIQNIKLIVKEIFYEQFADRKENKFNFYNLLFTIIINRYCSNVFSFTPQDTDNIMQCFNIMIKSNEIDLHEILLLCFKSLNNIKENANNFQMHFFKKFDFYVKTFLDFYKIHRKVIYLELIFYIPISVNLLFADWVILLIPIIEAIKSRKDIAIKAINYLLYLIDNTKKESYNEKYDILLCELIKEIRFALSNQKLSIYCAQILGRLKSFHRTYLYNDIYFEKSKSFLHDEIYGICTNQDVYQKNIFKNNKEKEHNPFKLQLHDLIIEIIYFFRGSVKFKECSRIRSQRNPVMFKNFEKFDRSNKKQVYAAFEILSNFVYSILGLGEYSRYNIVNIVLQWWSDLCDKEILIPKSLQETNDDFFLADINNSSYFAQLKRSQYMYDTIQALYACEGTIVESNALNLIKVISEVASTYWICRRFQLAKDSNRIYFNHLLIYRALLEGFEFTEKKMPTVVLHDLLTRAFEISGSSDNFLKFGILQFIYKQCTYLCLSSNVRKIISGCNGIYAIIIWDYLPMSWVEKELLEIITYMLVFIKYSDGKYDKVLTTFECLFDLCIISEVKNCASILYTPFINFLMSKNEHERVFAKKMLLSLNTRFKESDLLLLHQESFKLFFKDIGSKCDKQDIFIRLDVLVYVLKNFPYFLSSVEFRSLVKMFYYYLKHNQAFVCTSNTFYQTDVSEIYSSDYIKLANDIIGNQDFIFELYYKNKNEQSYTEYLKYESAFLYLAYCNSKEKGKHAFDFIFNTLPNGLIVPFNGFKNVNSKIMESLIRDKYEECLSEVLSVDTLKKIICTLLLLPKFNDERLVAFIEKIFLEFRNHREILIFTESPENSILIKTFELSLMYPEQKQLYDKIILVVYTLIFEFSKSYVHKIEARFLDYIESYSSLTYPLIVMNITNSAILHLAKTLFDKLHSFKNYVSNLGIANNKLGIITTNAPDEDEVQLFINNLDVSKIADLEKGMNLLIFLKLIEYEITKPQMQLSLLIFNELKKADKDLSSVLDYIKYSINEYSADDLEVLFKIDPLFRVYNTVKVKTFSKLRSKSVMGCLLKSISRNDVNSFENLLGFFGELSWMLIELFVEENVHSHNMIRYCKENLQNQNIKSYLLYYLCTFSPCQEYFSMLLELSHEERKYTLYCLKKIADKFYNFEKVILHYIRLESNYISNVFILYPLLISRPNLLTLNIVKELIFVIHRLFSTSIQLYYKLGAKLFSLICDFYFKNQIVIYEDNTLKEAYTKVVSFYLHLQRQDEFSCFLLEIIEKYDLVPDITLSNSINVDNLIRFLEIKINNRNIIDKILPQSLPYISDTLSSITLSNQLALRLMDLNQDLRFNKNTFFHVLAYKLEKDRNIYNMESLIYDIFKDELEKKENLPKISTKDNRSILFNRLTYGDTKEYLFDKVFLMIVKNTDLQNLIPFVTNIIKRYNNNNLDISEGITSVLLSNLSIYDSMSMYSIIYDKSKEGINILKQSDFLNCLINFFISKKSVKIQSLSNLTELFYFGLVSKTRDIRLKFFQLFDDMIPKDINLRFIELLSLDWSLADQNFIPYIFCRMLLLSLKNIQFATFKLFSLGISKTSFFHNSSVEKIGFVYKEETFRKYVKNVISNFQDFIQKYAPCDSLNKIVEYLYYSYDANISILDSIILNLEIPNNIDEIAEKIFILISCINDSEKLSLVFLKYLNKCQYLNERTNMIKATKYLRNGPMCWAYLAELRNSNTYKDMNLKDYYFGSIRSYSKLPEVSKASIYHQLGKIKEAQQIYEDFQSKAINSKLSYFDTEYDFVLDEWINCAKELQQWDITLNIGKKKKDNILIADSIFYTSNLNILPEKEGFFNFIKKHAQNNSDPNWLFYELFVLLFSEFNSEKAIELIKEINKKIFYGPNVLSYDSYYMIFLQIIFEMHEISFVFNNSVESKDKVTAILFRWEDREPKFENDFLGLLKFSTWRKHAYRKIEDYSNELKFSDLGIQEGDISGIVNKNKEYTETIKQLKKSMYFKGNNGLGKISNYLGLASLRRKYYDNALFSFKSVFDLPSIKVIDAYHKVIYELECFYEMKEYKLGLDLANSTNISHFLDDQSSNLCRMRGLFSEKLGFYDEAEQLYFQAIHLSNIGENYLCYIKLLLKKDIKSTDIEMLEEITYSILLGLTYSEMETSHDLMIHFISFLSKTTISIDKNIFKDLLNNCNINTFLFYISKLLDFISTDNYELINLILLKISEIYPQAVIVNFNLYLELINKEIIVNDIDNTFSRAYNMFTEIIRLSNNNNMISTLHKFTNLIESGPFKKEHSLISIVDKLITEIISLSYNIQDLKSKFIQLFDTSIMKHQLHNVIPFIQSLSYVDNIAILCPYKVVDILILIKQKIFLLMNITDYSPDKISKSISNDFLINMNFKKYLFGSYNKIRNDYKNIPYIEIITTTTNYCNIKHDKIEDLSLLCSDGKAYKYEYFNISTVKSNLNSIYNLISYKISNKYEINIRNGYLPVCKNLRIKKDVFINVIEHSYIDIDFIYEEYRNNCKLNNLIIDYMESIDKHSICLHDSNYNTTVKSNANKTIKSNEIEDDRKDIILNLECNNNFDVLSIANIKNIDIMNEEYKIFNGDYDICKFMPNLTNKTKLKCFINILENNARDHILKEYFKNNFTNPYNYLLFRNSMISSYATNFIVSYVLHTIHSNPNNIMIYINKGTYINKKIFNVEFMNETSNLKAYISPNIQYLFGKEGIEGQFLSLIYHSLRDLEDFISEILKIYEDIEDPKLKLILERMNKLRDVDSLLDIINEWTSLENMSKIPLSEFAWL